MREPKVIHGSCVSEDELEQEFVLAMKKNPQLAELLEPFEQLEKEEMQNFKEEFNILNGELAKSLMVEIENTVIRKVNEQLDWRAQKEICFFSPENQQELRRQIKGEVRKQIVIDLLDYGV